MVMNEERRAKIYTIAEILCVFCWFVLDGFWLFENRFWTYVFSFPAVIAAIVMFKFIKPEACVLLVACADTCWLLFNIFWAIGDMEHLKVFLLLSKHLFVWGLVFCGMAFYLTDARKKLSVLLLSRLRIMKFFEKK